MADQITSLPGLRLWRRRCSEPMSMTTQHFHSHYELYYLWEGQRQYFISNKAYHIQAGALVFINPGHIHRTTGADDRPHERSLVEIDEARYAELLARHKGGPLASLQRTRALVFQLDGADRPHVEWLLNELFREALAMEAAYREFVQLRLEEILLTLLRRQAGRGLPAVGGEKHKKVYDIADYIADSYGEILSLDQICQRHYIGKSHLCHIFKEVTGMTVQEYITMTRIKNAQQLLSETRRSVTWIAHTVGYGSITHFERMFKRVMGMTPLAYRAENRAE